jgi:hypothetical protein
MNLTDQEVMKPTPPSAEDVERQAAAWSGPLVEELAKLGWTPDSLRPYERALRVGFKVGADWMQARLGETGEPGPPDKPGGRAIIRARLLKRLDEIVDALDIDAGAIDGLGDDPNVR